MRFCKKFYSKFSYNFPSLNVSIYFYQGEQDVITDLDHYMDTIHFDSIVANKIVDYIADDDNKLTVDNYANVLDEFEAFLKNYDYVMLME